MKSLRSLAFAVAITALLLNIALEHFLLGTRPAEGVLIPGLLDLRYAWNNGVSFSLFRQDTVVGKQTLFAVLLLVSAVVAVFAWRARTKFSAIGFGLILGGALGGLLDRQLYGAVLDFLALHLGTTPLFVCNLSDIWISAGVLVLLFEELKPLLRRNNP